MRITNEHVDKRHQISVNRRRDKEGNPVDGLVITQARGFILIGRDEWLELCKYGDELLGIMEPEPAPKKRYRMI